MQAKSAKVYLPAGATWYDFWTNEKYDGGQEIERKRLLMSFLCMSKLVVLFQWVLKCSMQRRNRGIILN